MFPCLIVSTINSCKVCQEQRDKLKLSNVFFFITVVMLLQLKLKHISVYFEEIYQNK